MSAPALLHAAFNKNHEGFSKWPGLEVQPKVIYRMLQVRLQGRVITFSSTKYLFPTLSTWRQRSPSQTSICL